MPWPVLVAWHILSLIFFKWVDEWTASQVLCCLQQCPTLLTSSLEKEAWEAGEDAGQQPVVDDAVHPEAGPVQRLRVADGAPDAPQEHPERRRP